MTERKKAARRPLGRCAVAWISIVAMLLLKFGQDVLQLGEHALKSGDLVGIVGLGQARLDRGDIAFQFLEQTGSKAVRTALVRRLQAAGDSVGDECPGPRPATKDSGALTGRTLGSEIGGEG